METGTSVGRPAPCSECLLTACAGGAAGAQGQQRSVIGAGADKPVSTVPVGGANTGNTEVLRLPTCPVMVQSGVLSALGWQSLPVNKKYGLAYCRVA